MRKEHLYFICCPKCKGQLDMSISLGTEMVVEEGELRCKSCAAAYPITRFIPRFSSTSSYAETFGRQWRVFSQVQLDSEQCDESAVRFDSEVGWKSSDISDSVIMDIGCGPGRFLDIVARQGAKLAIGLDITTAVDSAYSNLGHMNNILLIQADVYRLPINEGSVDRAYSIGVIHHTPRPEEAFRKMSSAVKLGGAVALSVYENSLYARPSRNSIRVSTVELFWALNLWRCELFRIVTTRVPSRIMVAYCKTFIPILHFLNRVPVIRFLRYLFPSTCYRSLPVAWSMLDTMDTYSTKIVHQYRAKEIFQWFVKFGFSEVTLLNSRPGWVSVRGIRRKEGCTTEEHSFSAPRVLR